MSWTDERVELLKKMWLEGLSASQIAGELAHGITRNAVIGKVHRLGLSGRVKSPAPAPARARVKMRPGDEPRSADEASGPVAPVSHGNLALAAQARPAPAPAPRPASEEVVVPISQRVSIMELRESMCRWPLGDPSTAEFRYCGSRNKTGGGPYCPHHARIAYQPAQDRRRDRERKTARA
ncbi:GcrA family cell cycle regulator [uncultured Rhodoblastus sp.]|uniref:GcrA family cell cycle regulator n=1 Tax=uncultured Rhodoblastus sp. TaxID=543037 RepID=UPI0025DF31A8|nr:GcrA family cell cycle regulator [uncultured Rhodoblastus sp.]